MTKPAPADHPIHPLLAERWSPRAFSGAAVPEDTLDRLFEAARWAPSCFNEQPWGFVVAHQGDAEAFSRLGALLGGGNAWAKEASLLIIGTARTRFTRNSKPNDYAWYDLGQAVAHLSVQATHEGLSLHQMAGFDREAAKEALNLPDDWDAVVAIALGPQGEASTLPEALRAREASPRSRRPQTDFVFHGRVDG